MFFFARDPLLCLYKIVEIELCLLSHITPTSGMYLGELQMIEKPSFIPCLKIGLWNFLPTSHDFHTGEDLM